MKKRRPALGADPFDALVPPPSAGDAPGAAPARAAKRVKVTYDLSPATAARVRNAVLALCGPPLWMTATAYADQAFLEFAEKLEREHNGGQPFPVVDRKIKRGRPTGS